MTEPAAPGFDILVIDDDLDIRETLAEILQEEGYSVRCACDGQDAMDLLGRGSLPRLILLDLMMPRMNGWQFRAVQRDHPRLRDVPVVAISASANLSATERDLSGVAVLPKPVSMPALLAAARRHCSGSGS
jgi:CheY-like chemotaxis protein